MKNHANLYLCCLLLLTAFSCKKEQIPPPEPPCPEPCYSQYDIPGLPPVTDTGEGTLGFLLNGEPWVAEGYGGGFVDVHVAHNENTGYLRIKANRRIEEENISQYLYMQVARDVFETNVPYVITNSDLLDFRDECNYGYYLIDDPNNQVVVNHIDIDRNIISVRFSCVLYQEVCPTDTLRITNGRVDAFYESY